MQNKNPNTLGLALKALDKLEDDELSALQFAMPWQVNQTDDSAAVDPDFSSKNGNGSILDREQLQQACWNKFNENPQVSTAVGGTTGRLTGFGFEVSCEIQEIQDTIDEIELDQRNRLYTFWPKYVTRSIIEGELLLCLTVHTDGFIEVDFIDPSNITGGGEDGVIYHPTKVTMPLFYYVKQENTNNSSATPVLVPSIFVARYPELAKEAAKTAGYIDSLTTASRSTNAKFKKVGGFNRFIVAWDKGFVTKRNVSYLRTILEWLNHYENLKKYEIDHKKSAGSYLWIVTIEDPKAFRTWLSLSPQEIAKTGIMAKKTPGGTLVMPPGMKIECKNPSLPNISESDTDIFHMITSGLNEPEDVTSGQSKGTFASVKSSRGPMNDRIADQINAFEKFLRHDFYGGIFFLKNKVVNYPATFNQRIAVDFKNQEPVFKSVKKRPELLLSFSFPTSATNDAEGTARAFLGSKHGDTNLTLGIPYEEIAKKLGFGNYRKLRLQTATEKERYPELASPVDQPGTNKNPNELPAGNKNKPTVKPVLKKRIVKSE